MLESVRNAVQRARRTWRPPRPSFSYRYQLMADQSGPMSAIPLLAFQEQRIQNHAQFEGTDKPHPLRGVDEETRVKAYEDGDSDE